MTRGKTRKARAWPALWPVGPVGRVMVGAGVTAVAGLAVAMAAAPAAAVQHPAGPAASRTRLLATGQHTLTGGMRHAPHWRHIAAGLHHTCGTRPDGTLWCWGDNEFGQLGIGSHTGQDLPRQVTTPAPGGWVSVTTGAWYACATRTDGTLWCWGRNQEGQLGIGNNIYQFRPRQVTGCQHQAQPSPPGRRLLPATSR